MTPAALLDLTPTQRRLVRESSESRQVLDAWFNPRMLAGMQALGQEPGTIRRRGRRRIITQADPAAAKGWSVGQRVYTARQRKGWTQQALSDHCGIARANIARLETGRHTPGVATLRRVAEALQVPLAWILEIPGRSASPADRALAEDGIADWARELDRLDEVRSK